MVRIERVLMIRHGQTDWNIAGRWQGIEPVGLNAQGWEQARALAEHLRERSSISTIYTSDLPRALQTASVIGSALGIEPQIDIRWREFNLGIFQGYTREQLPIQFETEWRAFREQYWDYVVPNGESRRMFQNRVYSAWEDLMAQATGAEVVVVTHGGSIKHLLMKIFGENAPDVPIENTSVTTLERHQHGWELTEVAAVEHL